MGCTSPNCVLRFVTVFALLLFGACDRQRPDAVLPGASRTYSVTGILRAINFAEQSVTVEHSDVPGYMPAMTMPFQVKTMAEVEPLRADDPIRFDLIVTEGSSWIEKVTKIDRSEVSLPEPKPAAPSTTGNVARLREGDRLPDFSLTDSKQRTVTRQDLTGRPLLLTFIFTRCPLPNFCPLISRNLQEVKRLLAEEGPRGEAIQLLSISIDPEFDTPEVLARYAGKYTEDTDRWRFARATPEETQRLTQAFAVSVQPEQGTLSHGLATALADESGTIRQIWRGNGWKPEEVLATLRTLQISQDTPHP